MTKDKELEVKLHNDKLTITEHWNTHPLDYYYSLRNERAVEILLTLAYNIQLPLETLAKTVESLLAEEARDFLGG